MDFKEDINKKPKTHKILKLISVIYDSKTNKEIEEFIGYFGNPERLCVFLGYFGNSRIRPHKGSLGDFSQHLLYNAILPLSEGKKAWAYPGGWQDFYAWPFSKDWFYIIKPIEDNEEIDKSKYYGEY